MVVTPPNDHRATAQGPARHTSGTARPNPEGCLLSEDQSAAFPGHQPVIPRAPHSGLIRRGCVRGQTPALILSTCPHLTLRLWRHGDDLRWTRSKFPCGDAPHPGHAHGGEAPQNSTGSQLHTLYCAALHSTTRQPKHPEPERKKKKGRENKVSKFFFPYNTE
ncbi:hypothetical protein NDU88_000841 [Pleurodeles waltl]|uniref:Uncharacterized protein n=1 Tax=Pleurodeles waltl TaxID=8319 RepID=A0AAV7S9U4_PLEWA|nr:hypothetical protein NDU88_000841 [Pleurodeles waltl]